MRRLFGEIPSGVFFTYLDKKYDLTKSEIPNNPEAFAHALKEVLGSTAALFECTIVKQVYSNLGLESEEEGEYTFVECMRRIGNTTY